MQVNVFISHGKEGEAPTLLVLPYGPSAAIPRHLQNLAWRHLAITSPQDNLLGAGAAEIEMDIAQSGYCLVRPTG